VGKRTGCFIPFCVTTIKTLHCCPGVPVTTIEVVHTAAAGQLEAEFIKPSVVQKVQKKVASQEKIFCLVFPSGKT